jgi:hypothetical protein
MANTYTLIASSTVGSGGAATIDFTSIPATYTDLVLKVSARSTDNTGDLGIKLNTSTSSFSRKVLRGSGSAASSTSGSDNYVGGLNPSTYTASTFGNAEIYIPNYAGSTNKSISVDSITENNATEAFAFMVASLWSNTAAITGISLYNFTSGNLAEHSTASLYGISNVTSGSKATGGVVSSDGTYWYHTFPFSGTFTPTEAITVDYLVIAGGGSGGFGGGGAGGLRSTVTATGGGGSLESALSLTANTAYTVTVGAGGAPRTSGANSVFSTITSTGGGKGGGDNSTNALDGIGGGSGGGGGHTGGGNKVGGARTASPVQGNNGGAGGASYSGGGGGGAGAAGTAGQPTNNEGAQTGTNGKGGDGVQITAFATPTGTGADSGYYAAGGGGGYNALGGLGGGGRGALNSGPASATAAAANTGSGGGGGNGTELSGAGGSGLVIIRYTA